MDVRCRFCGEPIDTDEFHNGQDDFSRIYELYRKYGCPIAEQAMDGLASFEMTRTKCTRPPITSSVDEIGVILDLMGDDVDGAASMLE